MDSFVLSGKASQVFQWLEIKAQEARRAENEEWILYISAGGHICDWKIDVKCGFPLGTNCSLNSCPVFIELFGEKR